MKSSLLMPGRFALSGVAAAAALCLVMPNAWALGLGKMVVQSSLGEGLRAEIDISSLTPEEAANLKVRIAPPESYKSAGVDYNSVLPTAQVTLQRRADGRPYLRIASDRAVQEPFVDVILELNWNTGRLVREYTMLFDPPNVRAPASVPAPATPAAIAAAPAPAESRAPAALPDARPAAAPSVAARTPEPRPAPPPKAAPAPAPTPVAEPRKAPAAAVAGPADGYRVKPGDTLSRIAGRTQPQGVSLDQMLVALYRANPQAFVENNMNRLKSGVLLSVPDADAAKATAPAEAQQIIQAQSADFSAYRQRLAGAVTSVAGEPATRQASGQVQAEVTDRKQAAATTPDKLTLSKGSASAKASAPEDKLSKERESKDASVRTAELKKNVDELQRLAAGAKAPTPAAATPSAPPAAAAAPAAGPAILSTRMESAPAASAPSAAPPAAAVAVAPAVTPAASAPASAVAVAVAPVAASAVVPPAPAPKVATAAASRPAPAPAAVPEPGLMDSLIDDPVALAGGGLVLALLAGFGAYRYIKRSRRDSGETSFLESRLQPDSFFGVSGGQHIDTREAPAGPASSSMSYSLSQLDAIGDVDPVAEADVYLAYGRDLQAEEILKEAIRTDPGRLAIRSKLLEVYAKRRDAKGFELLALQLFSLTRGEGDEWAKAQELGAQIDPENPLYRPGGRPDLAAGDDDLPIEPLGASTMPQSVLPSPSQFGQAALATAVTAAAVGDDLDFDLDLDLDLDLPVSGGMTQPRLPEVTQPMPAPVAAAAPEMMAFDLPLDGAPAPAVAAAPTRDLSLDFDLSGISLDLDAPASAPMPLAEVSEGDTLELADGVEDGLDPFERKLELAEEFRQIGDMEGARDLLEEVIAQTGGAVQAKARNMLDNLS